MNWKSLQPFADARVDASLDGALEVRTPPTPGAYAVVLPIAAETLLAADAVGVRFVLDLEVLSGSVGFFASREIDPDPLGREVVCGAAGRTTIRVDGDRSTIRLCIRSGPSGGGHVRIHSGQSYVRRRFDVTASIGEFLPVMLMSPGDEALSAIAVSISKSCGVHISPHEIGELECRQTPVAWNFEKLWTDQAGRAALDVTRELMNLLPTYDPSKMNERHGYRNRELSGQYLRQSTIRVYHLIRQLRERGLNGGTVLEVGSLFGQFSLVLQRLGYQVTCIDRYRGYHGALDGYVAHLRAAGVNVIDADRSDEEALTAQLGTFDVVLSMAVIEHIPHTPREFLSMLGSHVAPGGVLALDTPNIARYWNRRRLATGLTIHQAIDDQFYSTIPYEGHHREYTAAELSWMLEQLGAADIAVRMFDYNLLQFAELWADQLDALLKMTVDPSLADTVLVAGRIDTFRSPTL